MKRIDTLCIRQIRLIVYNLVQFENLKINRRTVNRQNSFGARLLYKSAVDNLRRCNVYVCGIAGMMKRRCFVNENEKQEIDEMLLRINHRGPDDKGVCGIVGKEFNNQDRAVHIRNNVKGILGFNRLSIQDLSPAGHQPMLSDDRNAAISFNGELYNVDELKEKLRNDGCDMSFKGHSDTEVILKCYCMYGIDKTMQMLNGMFAIVIADIRKKRYILPGIGSGSSHATL